MLTTATVSAENIDVWIGTSRNKMSKGIYHCNFNTANGKLGQPELAAEISGPGFLTFNPSRTHLYAVGALNGAACVAAYKIETNGRKSQLKFLNSVPIGDGGAAHVSIERSGNTLLTAQYGGGSVGVFSLKPDGSIEQRTQLVEHKGGSKVVGRRQDSPHPHWTGYSPDFKFAFVPDLGLDQVVIYKLDADRSKLESHGVANVPPGGGPRHMKFHTSGKWAYVLNELSLSVTVFDYDADQGTMNAKQTIPTVPQSELAKEQFKSCSEIRVHPSGKFVYAANRGHDTITVFQVDESDGTLKFIERENVRGATPRNFNLDPTGSWLLAAGQDSHTLASFVVNQDTGELTYNRSIVNVPAPICVLFDDK